MTVGSLLKIRTNCTGNSSSSTMHRPIHTRLMTSAVFTPFFTRSNLRAAIFCPTMVEQLDPIAMEMVLAICPAFPPTAAAVDAYSP